jgi:PBP1b-binding outer membrane lipoprotein LpoB
MTKRHSWFLVVAIVALLVGACAPQELATPTTVDEETPQATAAPTGETSLPTTPPELPSSDEYPVAEDDWHVLGAPDAPVTMLEFSDFQ